MRRHFLYPLALVGILALSLVGPNELQAQAVDVTDSTAVTSEEPAVGQDRARPYFQNRRAPAQVVRAPSSDGGGAPRYLALHIGRMFADQSYRWGRKDQEDIGGLNAGVTYRMGEWINSMDWALRIDYTNYSLSQGSARKLSVGAILTFPDANSQFPLYFGGGIGPGFFIKQLPNESVVALDYQLLAGARFLNLFNNMGLMFEAGIKNHIFLLSDGQYNGVYVNVGTVFAF